MIVGLPVFEDEVATRFPNDPSSCGNKGFDQVVVHGTIKIAGYPILRAEEVIVWIISVMKEFILARFDFVAVPKLMTGCFRF